MAAYRPEQVMLHAWDLTRSDPEMRRALERQYNVVKGDNTQVFVGEYALVGSHEIETRLPQLIDYYLARGGVDLTMPILAPTPTPTPRAMPVVRAVMFWSTTCPYCHTVVEHILPPLQKEYGAQFDIRMFELSDPANLQLFQAALEALRVPPQQWAVPFMIVGDRILVGGNEIEQQLPALIKTYLAAGGIGWPPIPGLEQVVGAPVPIVTVTATRTPTPRGRAVTSGAVVRAALFWMEGCSSCHRVLNIVLPPLQQKYGAQLDVQMIQVVTSEDVQRLYRLGDAYGIPKKYVVVPLMLIGDQPLIGSDEIEDQLPALIEKYLASGGLDAPNLSAWDGTTHSPPPAERHVLDLPFVGQVDLDQHSLTFSTVLIGIVDGFNPCSLWVISLLLALVVNTGSRKKTLLVGLTFLLVAAGIYAVIILGLFSVFTFIGYALWIRLGVALIAVVLAVINIKDYFWFKEGVSLTIADEHKPKIYRDIRGLLAPNPSTLALVGATAAMALGITVIERPCTAGLPILWTKLIAANNVGAVTFAFLLGLYLLMYVLDELLVFISAVVTLRATRLEEKQGRMLKLVGGIVMLTLACVLLVDPTLMDNIVNSMLVFGVAFALAALVLFTHRQVLPRWGIVIGTEELSKEARTRKS